MAARKLDGAPKDAPPYYEGQERFTDGDFQVYPGWTAEVVLNALHIEQDEPKVDVEAQLAWAEQACQLEPAAFAACRRAG